MRRPKSRGALVALLCAGAALAVPASAGAITSKQCAARVNDTPSKLVECILKGDLSAHMNNLQAIANANPGPDGYVAWVGEGSDQGLTAALGTWFGPPRECAAGSAASNGGVP